MPLQPFTLSVTLSLRHTLTYFVFAFFLISCGTTPSQQNSNSKSIIEKGTPPEEIYDVETLVNFAKTSSSPEKEAYLFRAIGLLLEEGSILRSKSYLDQIPIDNMTQGQQAIYHVYRAQLAILTHNGDLALDWLRNIPEEAKAELTETEQITLQITRARAWEKKKNYLTAARERIFFNPLLSGDAQKSNIEFIWTDLTELTEEELQHYSKSGTDDDYQGWLQLALISKRYQFDIDQQSYAINGWISSHANHPAAKNLPGSLSLFQELSSSKPKKIALLLPLSGPLAKSGQAIRDGFLTSFYNAQRLNQITPEIIIYDTNGIEDSLEAVNQVVSQGAELIIGPLDKTHINKLIRSDLPVPVLALNYQSFHGSTPLYNEKLFEFGLSTEDEFNSITQRQLDLKLDNVAILAPDTTWGRRVHKEFSDRWLEKGGSIIDTQFYKDQNRFSKMVQKLFNVEDSQARAKKLSRTLKEDLEFTPRRRVDVDWLLMISTPVQGRVLKPLLGYNYAEDVPVVSISHIYAGNVDQKYNADLNGLIFTDIPWLYHDNEMKEQINQHMPLASQGYQRLFALGIDAFYLYPRVQQMKLLPASKLDGSTGILTVTETNRISRQVIFAQFL